MLPSLQIARLVVRFLLPTSGKIAIFLAIATLYLALSNQVLNMQVGRMSTIASFWIGVGESTNRHCQTFPKDCVQLLNGMIANATNASEIVVQNFESSSVPYKSAIQIMTLGLGSEHMLSLALSSSYVTLLLVSVLICWYLLSCVVVEVVHRFGNFRRSTVI